MWVTMLQNLEIIGSAFLLFCMCVAANIIIKTYNNTENLEQMFSWSRLWSGIKKMLAIGITTALLSMVASSLPFIPILGDMFQTQEIREVVSFLLVVALYARAIIKYFTKALTTTDKVINEGDITIFEQTKISGV